MYLLFFLIVSINSYLIEYIEHLNGKDYVIKSEQEFYRVYHPPHFKV